MVSGATPWTATGDVWTKTVGAKNYSFDESTGVLSMTSSGYDSWAASKGLTGGDAAFDADPDNDGLNNGLEFVLGGEPNPANPGSNSAALLPTMAESSGDLIFTIKRKDLSASQYQNPCNCPTPWLNHCCTSGVAAVTGKETFPHPGVSGMRRRGPSLKLSPCEEWPGSTPAEAGSS